MFAHHSAIPVSESAMGIYQEIIPLTGKEWTRSSTTFQIAVKYAGNLANTHVTIKRPEPSIELDRTSYSWTSMAHITITAPGLIMQSKEVARLSDADGCFRRNIDQ